MTAQIHSGADNTKILTIDATSKAARIALYGSDGNPAMLSPTGSYCLSMQTIRPAGVIASGAFVWAIRNGATKTIYITRIQLIATFDGVAAASTAIWEMKRFTGANPTGGTVLTALKKATSWGASTLQDARTSGVGVALGVAGITTQNPFVTLACQRKPGASNVLRTYSPEDPSDAFVLASNEGLALTPGTLGGAAASVVGDGISGTVEWFEV
jgi:hypothetical protein